MSDERGGTTAAGHVTVGRTFSLTEAEWRVLQFAPLWTFTLVAGCDRNPDAQERDALIASLNASQIIESCLLREACGAAARDSEALLSRFDQDARGCEEGLRDVARVVGSVLSTSEAEEFKRGLLALGVAIARASGGGLFGGGDRTSAVEEEALIRAGALLGVDPSPAAGAPPGSR